MSDQSPHAGDSPEEQRARIEEEARRIAEAFTFKPLPENDRERLKELIEKLLGRPVDEVDIVGGIIHIRLPVVINQIDIRIIGRDPEEPPTPYQEGKVAEKFGPHFSPPLGGEEPA